MNPWLTLAHLTLSRPPLKMIEAAKGGGFNSVGVRICPRRPGDEYFVNLLGAVQELRLVKRVSEDEGIRLSNVSAYQFYPEVDWHQLAPVIDATAELGSKILVVNCFDPERKRFLDRLYRYAEAAGQCGIRLALEFMPYSEVRTLDQAIQIVSEVGAASTGVLVDALHLSRSGATPDDLRKVSPDLIVFAQICDALASVKGMSNEELMNEARHARLPLGRGTLPLSEFLSALPPTVEIEYEVAGLPGSSPVEIARAAMDDLTSFLERQQS